jgi:hypothetical protein
MPQGLARRPNQLLGCNIVFCRFRVIKVNRAILAILLFAAPAYGQQAAIRYVSATGKDSNDGQSWGTSKATVFAALVSLPGGNVVGPFSGSGTVYVAPGSALNPSANKGIWLMSPHDPNYTNPPSGWLKCNGCTTNIVGFGNHGSGPNPHKNRVLIELAKGPAIWLSGTQQPIHIANFGFQYPQRGVVIGECSDGSRKGTCGVSGVVLDNVTTELANRPDSGPCTDLTGGSFWIWLRDYGCGGNAYHAAKGRFANNAAAILIDGAGNFGNGLIHITDTNLAGGGIKFIPGANGGSLFVTNAIEEGDSIHPIPPTIWFTSWDQAMESVVSNIQTADGGPSSSPTVQNDGSGPGPVVISADMIQGPAIVLGQHNATFRSSVPSPIQLGQVGFFNGYLVGETDVARRIAGLVPVRFVNLAASNPALWTTGDPRNKIMLGQADPFGGSYAGMATTAPAMGFQYLHLTSPTCGAWYTPKAGDWIIAGAWVKGDRPLGVTALEFCGYPSPVTSYKAQNDGQMKGDGQWQWEWKAEKISGGTAAPVGYYAQFSSSSPITVYGPVLYIIPSGTLSDNEVLEFVSTMTSVDSACPVGSICNMPGHPLVTIK